MDVLTLVNQLADLTDEAIDEQIDRLQSQLNVLKMVKKSLKGGTGTSGKPGPMAGRKYGEVTVEKVLAVVEALGTPTSMEVRKNLPDCHWNAVVKCLDDAVEKGRLRKDNAGRFRIPK